MLCFPINLTNVIRFCPTQNDTKKPDSNDAQILTKALAAIGLAAVMSQSAMAENLKLGFLVKQPEEPWFQTEWKFADKAGKDLGFEVIKIAVPDGEKH